MDGVNGCLFASADEFIEKIALMRKIDGERLAKENANDLVREREEYCAIAKRFLE